MPDEEDKPADVESPAPEPKPEGEAAPPETGMPAPDAAPPLPTEPPAPPAPSSAPDPGMQWYVLRVQTGREEGVKEALEKLKAAKNMGDRIGRIVIPTEKRTEIKSGKRQTREYKLYPGYVIVSMIMSEETWFAVRETPGVGDFLGLKDPIPLQEHEVQKMLHMVDASADEKPKMKVTFNVGDPVRVREGAFENFEGKVAEINEKKGSVKVSMEVFGRSTIVELEYWQLEKVD